MSNDHESLVTQAVQGNDTAIGTLLDRHLPALRAYIRLRMGPRIRRWDSDADVAQSVCLEVLKQLDGFVYSGEAAFRQWLFTMARRKLSQREDHLRAERRDVDQVISNVAPPGRLAPVERAVQQAFCAPSQVAIGRETLDRIEKLLDGMAEDTREIILMHRLAGLSTPEIAERLGKPMSTVRSTLCRGIAALGRALSD